MKVLNEARYDVYTCALWNTIRWYYVFFIKTVYCRGSGFELLSAFLSLAVCHDSSVRWLRKFPMSMTFALSKSITWSLSHACFAMFEPLLCFLTFLMCSAFLVFRDLPVFPCACLTLESWHTAKDRNANNNSKPLPRQYTVLIKKT